MAKNIRIYNDLGCDCGKRRNKRDKSSCVIGNRLHTLIAMDTATGHRVPLATLVAPANHHDSHFLPFLVKLGQAMGVDDGCHDFKCDAAPGECTYAGTCPKCRIIPRNIGQFQSALSSSGHVQEAQDLRKNCERNFNLLKHQTGLETVRVRSQQATLARCAISSMAVLLIKTAGVRQKSSTSRPAQQLLPETKKAA